MVMVRVQHPPEASVKIHQVLKVGPLLPACCSRTSSHCTVCPWLQVPGSGPALQALASSTASGSAGAPAPAGGALPAPWGGGSLKQQSEFKYCFREVKDGQVRTRDTFRVSVSGGRSTGGTRRRRFTV